MAEGSTGVITGPLHYACLVLVIAVQGLMQEAATPHYFQQDIPSTRQATFLLCSWSPYYSLVVSWPHCCSGESNMGEGICRTQSHIAQGGR